MLKDQNVFNNKKNIVKKLKYLKFNIFFYSNDKFLILLYLKNEKALQFLFASLKAQIIQNPIHGYALPSLGMYCIYTKCGRDTIEVYFM